MAKLFRGTAGAMPSPNVKGGFGGGGGGRYEKKGFFFSEPVSRDGKTYPKKIGIFKTEYGEKRRPVVVLDNDMDYAIRVHKFEAEGAYDNHVVCMSGIDPTRSCPVCAVLEKPFSWCACLTVIDRKPWSPSDGKNVGKVYDCFRKLVLINNQSVEKFIDIAETSLTKGWRGSNFLVSRTNDPKSPRTGDWNVNVKLPYLSETEMCDEFERAAADYGMTAEGFIAPINYENVLKPLSYERLAEIAKLIPTQKYDSGKKGAGVGAHASAPKTGRPADAANPAPATEEEAETEDDGQDGDLPF